MIKNINTIRILLFGGILISGLMLGACNLIPGNNVVNPTGGSGNDAINGTGNDTDKDDDSSEITYSDLTEEDFELIEYVNTHSDYVFELLGEMENGHVLQEVGDLYNENSEDLLVSSYGVYLNEFDKVLITQINLSDESDYNILGVHIGDTYKDAKEILENEGFQCYDEVNYGKNNTYTSYAKGCVKIFVSSSISDDVALEDQEIYSITVSTPIKDSDDGSGQNQTDELYVTASDRNSNSPIGYAPKAGDEVYNGYASTITVKSVTDDEIEFELTGCLVEPNPSGSINLNKEPLKELTLKKGQKIKLKSQTMDGGVTIVLEYKK